MSPFMRGAVRGGALGHMAGGLGLLVAWAWSGKTLYVVLGGAALLVGAWVWRGTDTAWWRGEAP